MEEWKKNEVKKFVENLKENPKYDQTAFSVKAWLLQYWLKKTFKNTTIKDSRTLLYDCEGTVDDELGDEGASEPVDVGNTDEDSCDARYGVGDECHNQDVECETLDSPDVFDEDSEEMEVEEELTRVQKERVIQSHIDTLDKNMLENQRAIPEFVQNSRLSMKIERRIHNDICRSNF